MSNTEVNKNPLPSATVNNSEFTVSSVETFDRKQDKSIENSSEKCTSISVGRSPLKNIYSVSESNNIQLLRNRSPLRNEENFRSLFRGATIKENVITINVTNNYNQHQTNNLVLVKST